MVLMIDPAQINPLGTVPFVSDGETVLTESCAAPMYIAQKWGYAPFHLLPTPISLFRSGGSYR